MSTETETKPDSKPEIEFNERTLEAFEKEKLDIPHGVLAEKERHDKFKSKFKEEKEHYRLLLSQCIEDRLFHLMIMAKQSRKMF